MCCTLQCFSFARLQRIEIKLTLFFVQPQFHATPRKVHGLSLAAILAALHRNPHDVSAYRIAAAKYAMIRGIKKIAIEYKARQRGQLTRNAYVTSLLAKFQDDDFTSKPV